MSVVDLVMPKLGESIMEATILKWHKKEGDHIKEDETVLDIATDKVDSEVPSTTDGVIETILYKENDVVPVGTTIAKIRIGLAASVTGTHLAPPNASQPAYEEASLVEDLPYHPTDFVMNNKPSSGSSSVKFYSPLVLNIAQQEGIGMVELEKIPGTGQDGRVSKKDILSYIANGRTSEPQPESLHPLPVDKPIEKPVIQETNNQVALAKERVDIEKSYSGNVEIIEMDRMRKMISKHMVDSKHTSAHVTSFAECDVTNLVLWREKVKKEFEKREGEKITYTPLFIEAIIKSIKKYPLLSSSVEGDRIIIKKDLNIGMATALPSGNLIVPVIKNADQLNLTGLTKRVNGLANAARTGKLKPDDTMDGTFTLTNVGTFGSIMGTPIINQPQVAIMAVGAIKKRPVVIETPQGDSIAIRHMMYISLSYDHRIIDGALGSTFLNSVSKELENFDGNRSI